jgi:hypothetical protein
MSTRNAENLRKASPNNSGRYKSSLLRVILKIRKGHPGMRGGLEQPVYALQRN